MNKLSAVILVNEPLSLSASDLAHGNNRFECDCACSDKSFILTHPSTSLQTPLVQPALHTQPLPADHTLMFNPHTNRGVAVLNDSAYQVWAQFAHPKPVAAFAGDADLTSAVTRLLDAGLLMSIDADVHPKRTTPQTLSAWLHVTNECNLRCDYCYVSKSDDDMPEAIGRAAVDAIFRSAQKHGFKIVRLKFAGGEATLNLKRVFDIHDYAIDQAQLFGLQLDAVVLSNGVSIGPRAIQAFEQRGIRVSISLDGVGAVHDTQRKSASGHGSFAQVDRTLNKLVARGIKPFISITLSGRTAQGLPDVIRYVLDRDLPFNINFFRENDCAASFADLRLQDDLVIDAMRRACTVIELQLPTRSLLGALIDRAQFDQPHEKTCSAGESYLVIDHKGNISKCQMEIERPVASVFDDDPLIAIRDESRGLRNLPVDEKEGCRSCEWKYWCAGGCPALTFRATGRYDVQSPNCRIYKAIYPELLRLEGLRLMKLAGLLS